MIKNILIDVDIFVNFKFDEQIHRYLTLSLKLKQISLCIAVVYCCFIVYYWFIILIHHVLDIFNCMESNVRIVRQSLRKNHI